MQKIEQTLINWVSSLVQKFDPEATTIPHWAAVILVAIMSVGSIPFDSKMGLEILAGGLAVIGLPTFAIMFHKAGVSQTTAKVVSMATITTIPPAIHLQIVNSSIATEGFKSDELDKLYPPIKDATIEPISGIIDATPATAVSTEGLTEEMPDLSASESKLLSLLVQAGKDNSSALVSAVNAKGVTAEKLMAQAATKLIAKHPTLGNYDGAESNLAADMVTKAGGAAAAIALANEILVTEEFGAVPPPASPEKAPVAAPEPLQASVGPVLGATTLAPVEPVS